MSKTILLVGHCGPDMSMIRSALRSFLPDAVFTVANDEKKLTSLAPESDLLLINRVLDGAFTVDGGLDLLDRFAKEAGTMPPVILISDIDEAQKEAERRGARPGFGKRALRSDATRNRVLTALGLEDSSAKNV